MVTPVRVNSARTSGFMMETHWSIRDLRPVLRKRRGLEALRLWEKRSGTPARFRASDTNGKGTIAALGSKAGSADYSDIPSRAPTALIGVSADWL
ncbi:hypothetical protein LP7551_01876 [Roseibium album]|nr:hypothetical protein LP7551_01876 [Roseibium album]